MLIVSELTPFSFTSELLYFYWDNPYSLCFLADLAMKLFWSIFSLNLFLIVQWKKMTGIQFNENPVLYRRNVWCWVHAMRQKYWNFKLCKIITFQTMLTLIFHKRSPQWLISGLEAIKWGGNALLGPEDIENPKRALENGA